MNQSVLRSGRRPKGRRKKKIIVAMREGETDMEVTVGEPDPDWRRHGLAWSLEPLDSNLFLSMHPRDVLRDPVTERQTMSTVGRLVDGCREHQLRTLKGVHGVGGSEVERVGSPGGLDDRFEH